MNLGQTAAHKKHKGYFMKKPLTSTSGIITGDCFTWAGADDFSRRYIKLDDLSEEDKAVVMRCVNINAARAAAGASGRNIAIEGEQAARLDCAALLLRLQPAALLH